MVWVKAQLEHFKRGQRRGKIILYMIFAIKGSRETGLYLGGGLGSREDFLNTGRVLAYLSAYGKDAKKMRNDDAIKRRDNSGVMSWSS